MAYRNGTYVAFHANGTTDPTESDMKYYRLLMAWDVKGDGKFEFINSHEKTVARDWASKERLRQHMRARMDNSKNMILVIGDTTRFDMDWIPFEIEYAVDVCQMPIIAAYPNFKYITAPEELRGLWPIALRERIDSGEARVIHVPFKQEPLANAVERFDHNNFPPDSLSRYTIEAYRQWGIAQ